MSYERKDYYYQKAKQQGLRARSSFKLVEIQNKYKIIQKNSSVLDIGCAPGGWLQIVKKYTTGTIVGVDIVPMQSLPGVKFFQMDVTSEEFVPLMKEKFGSFDVFISDIAPKTSGIRERDQAISYELSLQSLHVATQLLKRNGNLVVKTFQSQETEELVAKAKKYFTFVKRYVPESTRKGSKELYVVATGFR